LPQLVGLSSKDVDFFVEGDGGVLQSTNRGDSLSGDGPTPLEAIEIEDQQVVEPELAIASAEHEHLVIDDAGGVELSHGSLSTDDAGYVEAELIHALLQVDKNNVGKNLETVPSSVNDDLTAVPDLAGVAHSWLG
jgi:hypothetical protein